MVSDQHNNTSRMTRKTIELTAIIIGAIAALCSVVQFVVWIAQQL